MALLLRSGYSQAWVWVKQFVRNRSLRTHKTTVEELYLWVTNRSLKRDFEQCSLGALPCNFVSIFVGNFVDALRETPNLKNIDDMSPEMLYLAVALSNRADFHPDTLERAIRADHQVVRELISKMGAEQFLQFVTERQIPLGAESVHYLLAFSNCDDETKDRLGVHFQQWIVEFNFWMPVVRAVFCPLRLLYMIICLMMPLLCILTFVWVLSLFDDESTRHLKEIQFYCQIRPYTEGLKKLSHDIMHLEPASVLSLLKRP